MALVTTTLYVACAQVAPDPSAIDATTGDSTTSTSSAICPEDPPQKGAACTHPEGTTCAFGTCATYAICTGGTWKVAPPTTPTKLCPTLVPEDRASCGACFEDGGTCVYGDPTCGDASTNAAVATCRLGRFSVRVVPCVEAGVDSGADARPDDAGADAALDAPIDG